MTNHEEEIQKLDSMFTIVKAIVIVVFAAFMIAMICANWQESKAKFMGECRKDHKQYECDVLWGQAN